jgi:hypothetical protein
MSEQFETTWAAADRALLDVALAALPPTVAVGPVVEVEWGGTTSYAVRLSTTVAPLGAPPAGIREELAPVAGVFMQGPRKPTPLEWMDRIPAERQVMLLEVLSSTPQGRWFKDRMLAAREIDPKNAETVAGVQVLRGGGVLTAEEAAALLA